VIVEMSAGEYLALERNGSKEAAGPKASAMSTAELVAYVQPRLAKLRAISRESKVRSIEAMFQFTGGIDPRQIDAVLVQLDCPPAKAER
jgi:hypothetical protein